MLGRILLLISLTAWLTVGSAHHLFAQAELSHDSTQQIMIQVVGISCPFCAFGLEKRLGRIEGVTGVRIELKEGKAIVTAKQGATISKQMLRKAVEDAGFTPGEIIFLQ